jgi:cytochrome c biogenesis protein CcmG/thiol:disulfide interchange protein DsbE
MREMRKILLVLCLAVVLIALARPSLALEAGQPLPDIVLRSVDGGYISLSSFKGKIVVINFWATWSPPCRNEVLVLNAIARQYRNVEIFAITNEGAQAVRDFMRQQSINYTVLLDSESSVYRRLGISQIPVTFLVDKTGTVKKKYSGPVDLADLKTAIDGLR